MCQGIVENAILWSKQGTAAEPREHRVHATLVVGPHDVVQDTQQDLVNVIRSHACNHGPQSFQHIVQGNGNVDVDGVVKRGNGRSAFFFMQCTVLDRCRCQVHGKRVHVIKPVAQQGEDSSAAATARQETSNATRCFLEPSGAFGHCCREMAVQGFEFRQGQ